MDSHKQSICQIFDSGVTIEVPFFQRAYVWTIEEWAKFLADMADFAAFNEVYAKYFTQNPARSCVAVKDLPKGVLCEVEVIAYLGK